MEWVNSLSATVVELNLRKCFSNNTNTACENKKNNVRMLKDGTTIRHIMHEHNILLGVDQLYFMQLKIIVHYTV